jgi:ribonuclease H-related protein
MAKKKFYAIKKGFDTEKNEVVENLILTSWAEAARFVQGINEKKHGVTPEYKGFSTREEAEAFLGTKDPLINKSEGKYPKDCLHCYVDGSFNKEIPNYAYGLVCVLNNQVIHFDKGTGKNKEAISMQQIGGELLGAMKALLFAKKHGHKKVVIFHDYKGVCYHATGFWKLDNKFSEEYHHWIQKFFKENPDIEVIFCKVDAHKGDDFNELADGLAKMAVGIEPDKIFFKMVEKYHLTIH